MNRTRVRNEQIIEAYKATGSVWLAAKSLGISGQSVHERLVAMQYPITNRTWSPDEINEMLMMLQNGVTAGEIASRLGRTFAAITCKLNELNIKGYRARRDPKIPRGAGYDKSSMHNHLKSLESADTTPTSYCRSHGLAIESFAAAAQRHFPERWEQLFRSRPMPQKQCPGCEVLFFPNNGKQIYCARLCASRERANRSYFGGRRMEAIGMREGVCQVCSRQGQRRLTPHHVIGKDNDPDNDYMIALCSGCHQLVTLLGARAIACDAMALQTLVTLGVMRRMGKDVLGKELYVEVIVDCSDIEHDDAAVQPC